MLKHGRLSPWDDETGYVIVYTYRRAAYTSEPRMHRLPYGLPVGCVIERKRRPTSKNTQQPNQSPKEPVESKTRTHQGRVESASRKADGWAGRRSAEQGPDISIALGANRPSGSPAHCKPRLLDVSSQARTREILCKPVEEQNPQLTRG